MTTANSDSLSPNSRPAKNQAEERTTNVGQPSALVIEHRVKKENVKRYEKWTEEILSAVSRSPGYLGREVFPPSGGSKPYTILVRFESETDVQTWLDSSERKGYIEAVQSLLEDGDKTQIRAGIDVWFTPDDAPAKPPAHKQFLLTLAGIYPLTLIVPKLLSPLFEAVPILENPFISKFFVAVVIVGMMTYLIMPHATHWLHDWLFDVPANRN